MKSARNWFMKKLMGAPAAEAPSSCGCGKTSGGCNSPEPEVVAPKPSCGCGKK